MKHIVSTKRIIYSCTLAIIFGGVLFIALLPTKLAREELDLYRIEKAQNLETAIEQYILSGMRNAENKQKMLQ